MTMKNRLSKLESQIGIKVRFEDIIKVLHDRKKGMACDREWHRIQSSQTWKEIYQLLKMKNN